jgi:hypothetical protein
MTNDSFTITGTEAQNAANVLTAKLRAFSGGQSTIVFATTNGSARVTEPAAKTAIETAIAPTSPTSLATASSARFVHTTPLVSQ